MDSPLTLIRKAGRLVTRYLKNIFDPDSQRLDYQAWMSLSRQDRIKIRRAYYDSDDLYDRVQTALEEKAGSTARLLPLRNPARQVVEFHVNHLFPGMLKDCMKIVIPDRSSVANDPASANGSRPTIPTIDGIAREDALTDAIEQIHEWSNLAAKKQPAVRAFARDGELYIKIVEHPDRDQVYWQFIDTADVVDFDEDERGFLTWIRIDIIKYKRDKEGKQKPYTITEVWSKEDNSLSVYEHDKDWGADLSHLGVQPTVTPLMSDDPDTESFGIDFIPIVRAPFIEVFGKKEGQAAIDGAFDKIDEANRFATRVHRLIASEHGGKWVLRANMVDSTGRPMPAPKVETNADGELEVGGNKIFRLPGMSELQSLVPDIDYAGALALLKDHLRDMEDDLPEMAYKRLREQGEMSGVAMRILLGDAIARGEEAQANLAAAFIRANQMSLTIAQRAGIVGFEETSIGNFENGDFDHQLDLPPIIPIPVSEQATTFQSLTSGQMPIVPAMRIAGFDEEDIEDVALEQAAAEQRKAESFAQATLQATNQLRAQQQQSQGQNGNTQNQQQQQGQGA